MIATEHDQLVGGQRLYADRQPVDAGVTPRDEMLAGTVGGVGFERDLEILRPRTEPFADRRDRLRDAVGPPQRRGAAAEVDRDQTSGISRRAGVELAEDRGEIRVVLGRADLDGEIAVRAQLAAPRVVEVDA
jgi:hypothetical protein